MSVRGIDVSKWNGVVDFEKVKAAGIDFVIIRAGFGKMFEQRDINFERNYKNAKAAGLDVGAYWYSYAHSADEARKEALTCIEVIKNKKFEYPIYFDIEENSQFKLGKIVCSDMVRAFCETLEKAGYFAGLYTGRYALGAYITPEVSKRFAVWVAEWAKKCNYTGNYGLWQNSSVFKVNGISGNVDHNFAYVDYPKIIKNKGLNGYKATASATAPAKPATPATPVVEKLKVGDKVKIVGKYAASAYDTRANNSKAIGRIGYITKIYEDGKYPYLIGAKKGDTAVSNSICFASENAIEKA